MILAVSGFVPIPNHPRSIDEYCELSHKLIGTGIPLMQMTGDLEQCWLYQYLYDRGQRITHSVADNPQKNSLAYHIVQSQKTSWLAEAADYGPPDFRPDVLVWIDLGIFHIPGVTASVVRDFMQRAVSEQAIAIPGCWNRNYEYNDDYPCWRFCGGLMVVPRKYAEMLDMAMRSEYKRWIKKTNNVSWEVNTLARVEERCPEIPLWHYKADHDVSMFKNYRTMEYAG